jgi:XTP/dITP diphosphohydrolase
VTVLLTSPRLPGGLLSWPAWQAVHAAPVETSDAEHPQLAALQAAGVDVRVVEAAPAEHLAARLRERAASGEPLVWLASVADAGRLGALGPADGVTVLEGSADPPGARLLDVVAVMDRLRSPGGCPWDAEQTHASLAPYLLEEAYEAYATLEEGDLAGLREELGDVLLQVVFHARLAQEHPRPGRSTTWRPTSWTSSSADTRTCSPVGTRATSSAAGTPSRPPRRAAGRR